MVVHVAAVPLPVLLGDEGLEVRVADVGYGGGEAEETPGLRGPARVVFLQAVGLASQAVFLHGALGKRNKKKTRD